MSRSDYEWYTPNLPGRGDIATQVYDVDLDRGAFSVLHRDGWKSYPVGVVCDAAHQASNPTRLSVAGYAVKKHSIGSSVGNAAGGKKPLELVLY